jgi:hypothetical protein
LAQFETQLFAGVGPFVDLFCPAPLLQKAAGFPEQPAEAEVQKSEIEGGEQEQLTVGEDTENGIKKGGKPMVHTGALKDA